MRGCLILPLNRTRAEDSAEDLADLDHRCYEEMGSAFAPEPWGPERFVEDRPGRFDFSVLAVGWDGALKGFWIASPGLPSVVCCERWAVRRGDRGQGIATRMLRSVRARMRDRGARRLVLEIMGDNEAACRFCATRGLRPTAAALRVATPLAAGLPRGVPGLDTLEPQAWTLQVP